MPTVRNPHKKPQKKQIQTAGSKVTGGEVNLVNSFSTLERDATVFVYQLNDRIRSSEIVSGSIVENVSNAAPQEISCACSVENQMRGRT